MDDILKMMQGLAGKRAPPKNASIEELIRFMEEIIKRSGHEEKSDS